MSTYVRFGHLALLLLVVVGCSKGLPASSGFTGMSKAPQAVVAAAAPATPVASHAFASLPDRGELVAYAPQGVRRAGAYTWHRAALSEAHALRAIADGHLRVTTPSGRLLDFQYDRHIEHASGDWTWVGHVAGHPEEQTILTFGARAAFGSIAQPGELPLRLTVRDGASWLVETDPRKLAMLHNAATRPQRPDFKIAPKTLGLTGAPAAAGSVAMASAPTMASATAASPTTVDVVLGYTPAFASDHNGTSGAITRLNYLVDVTNVAYTNSQIDANVRLVATLQVSYPDATSNDSTLEKLTGYDSTTNKATTPDPAFNALRAARDQYGADLVSMVRSYRDPENDGCGIAWLIGGGQSGVSSGDSYFGYSVVSDGSDMGTDGKNYYCLDETLAHELGHNMGAAHDVETSKGDDGTLDAGDYGAYSYSFGYKTTSTNGNFYTVMAYGDTGQKLYRIFSNPRSTFCGGRACGNTTQADNARTLSQTIPTIATFRATTVFSQRRARNDVDGDGKSDLAWHKPGTLGTWLMNGGNLKSHAFFPVASAYHVIGTGDLNGDRKVDLLWTSAANDLYLWQGSGRSFAARGMSVGYPVGWTLAGVGDINGDGKDDLVWQKAGQLAYWIMNGATITRTAFFDVATQYRVFGVGDFNGDSRLDLAWTSPANDLFFWLGNGTRFDVQRGAVDYPVGWNPVAIGDVDADGKSDVVWQRGSKVVYWKMNGSGITRTATFFVSIAYTVIGSGDYNGDGKLDLLFTSSANDLYWWRGSGNGFVSARMALDYPVDWSLASR